MEIEITKKTHVGEQKPLRSLQSRCKSIEERTNEGKRLKKIREETNESVRKRKGDKEKNKKIKEIVKIKMEHENKIEKWRGHE